MVDMSLSAQPFAGLPVAAPPVISTSGNTAALPRAPSAVTRDVAQDITPEQDARLRSESKRFEAAFLAEMLRYTGLGRMPESFNGGAGEAAFSGSLVQEYANLIAATGTLGISEQIYKSLLERSKSGLGQ